MGACTMRGRLLPIMLAGLLSQPVWADDLLSLYRDARVSDATYLAAKADSDAMREALPQARGQLLPNISINGVKSKNSTDQTSQTIVGPRTVTYDYDSHNYSLVLKQPLFRPYNFALYAQSLDQVDSADANQDQAGQELAMRLVAAYFDVLLARADLEVNEAQQKAYETQLSFAEKSFRAGVGTRTDVDEARSSLDAARAQAIELKYTLEYKRDALQVLVNRPLTPLATLSPERVQLQPPEPNNLEEWVKVAESLSPKLKALQSSVSAAEKEVWKARSGHLPTVDLVAQRSKSESENNTSIGTSYDTSMIGVQVSIPVFSGGHTNSVVRQAQASLEKQRQQLEAARREVRLMVRKQFDAASQGVHWVRAYELALKSAEQTLLSTRKGFQAGTRNNLDILNAEQAVANARRDLHRGRYQYVVARLNLLGLVGRLDDQEMRHFNAWLESRP